MQRPEPSDPRKLLRTILSSYVLPVTGTHGVTHWARVLENGHRLAPHTGADLRVVELFALLHDSQRHSDGRDPLHGSRAAGFARQLRAELGLEPRAFDQLVEACETHTYGASAGAPATVLTCFDADRLDIPRVGLAIRPELLFTPASRDPHVLSWATERASQRVVPTLLWEKWGWREGQG